jgi:hypothetical protein
VKQKRYFNWSVGASSILMIFVVLCLTTFGILSYVTANADNNLSTKNAETVENYYKATALSEEMLRDIDTALLGAAKDAKQAAESGDLTRLSNYSQYRGRRELEPAAAILKTDAPEQEKAAVCYRAFAEMLLTRLNGVTVKAEEDSLSAVYFTQAGAGRRIQTTLMVFPYGSTERYQVISKNLVNAQPVESGLLDDETIELWQGNSSAPTE